MSLNQLQNKTTKIQLWLQQKRNKEIKKREPVKDWLLVAWALHIHAIFLATSRDTLYKNGMLPRKQIEMYYVFRAYMTVIVYVFYDRLCTF